MHSDGLDSFRASLATAHRPVEEKKKGGTNRTNVPFPRGKKGLSDAKGKWQNAVGVRSWSNKPEMAINLHESKIVGKQEDGLSSKSLDS